MKSSGTEVDDEQCVYEAAMAANFSTVHGQQTPVQGLLGVTPRDFVGEDMSTPEARTGILEGSPDPGETSVRVRMSAKSNIMRALVEEQMARANHTRQQQVDQSVFLESSLRGGHMAHARSQGSGRLARSSGVVEIVQESR